MLVASAPEVQNTAIRAELPRAPVCMVRPSFPSVTAAPQGELKEVCSSGFMPAPFQEGTARLLSMNGFAVLPVELNAVRVVEHKSDEPTALFVHRYLDVRTSPVNIRLGRERRL
jgi:hypothetical protein